MHKFILLSLITALLISTSTLRTSAQDNVKSDKILVYTVNYPLNFFAKRIGGDNVEVIFPAPSNVDPALWNPGADTIREYQKADIILLNGAGYAKWLKTATLPKSKLVNTSKSFEDKYIPVEEQVTHTHGPKGEHAHSKIAVTTWLDPLLAIEQASAIKEAFVKRMPEHEKSFETGFANLKNDLELMDQKIREIVSTDPEKPLFASHPVYQYLAARYGLNLVSMHWEPDEYPGPVQWQTLEHILNSHPAKYMIWEGPPTEETKNKLSSIDIGTIIFSPMGNTPNNGDYLTVMDRNIENLRSAFK